MMHEEAHPGYPAGPSQNVCGYEVITGENSLDVMAEVVRHWENNRR